MNDSVLRCLIEIRLNGTTLPHVKEMVPAKECFHVVLEWYEGMDGFRRPYKFVPIPLDLFDPVPSPSSPFEYVCRTGIDLDVATTTDIEDEPPGYLPPV